MATRLGRLVAKEWLKSNTFFATMSDEGADGHGEPEVRYAQSSTRIRSSREAKHSRLRVLAYRTLLPSAGPPPLPRSQVPVPGPSPLTHIC